MVYVIAINYYTLSLCQQCPTQCSGCSLRRNEEENLSGHDYNDCCTTAIFNHIYFHVSKIIPTKYQVRKEHH